MDRLIRQPCAMPFLIPVDFNNTEYYENVSNPISLNQIMENILLNKYSRLTQWKNDMYLIAKNATSFNGKNSFYSIMGNRLIELFDKEYNNIIKNTKDYWFENFDKFYKKMNDIDKVIPDVFKYTFLMEKLIIKATNEEHLERSNDYKICNPNFTSNVKKNITNYLTPFLPVNKEETSNVTTENQDDPNDITQLLYNPIYYDDELDKYSDIFGNYYKKKNMFVIDFKDSILQNVSTKIEQITRTKSEIGVKKQRGRPRSNKNGPPIQRKQKQTKPKICDDIPIEHNESDDSQEFYNSITEHDINIFISASSILDTQQDAIKMARIIKKYHPKIDLSDNVPAIDLHQLGKRTIYQLIKYTQKRFDEIKMDYPS